MSYYPNPSLPTPQLAFQQPPSPANCGWVRVTTTGSFLTAWAPPTMSINGYPVTHSYGTIDVPMPPGLHRVEGISQAMWKYGYASLDVQVTPGAVVPVFYAAPVFTVLKGAIGHVPQKHPGMSGLIALAVLAAAFILFAIILIAIGASN